MKQISKRLFQVELGVVNTFLLEDADGLTLIDTGLPGTTDKLLAAIRKGGKKPEDIKRVILTHWHPDHAGNTADLKHRLNARVYAHATDAPLIEQGGNGDRPRYLTPGLINTLVFNVFIKKMSAAIPPAKVDEWLTDQQVLPLAGGLRVVHTPGHSAGHVALLLEQEGVLIAGDLCANMAGLAYSTVYEDMQQGRQSILQAAALPFDQAVFGHGRALQKQANRKLKEQFERPYPARPLKAV